MMGVMFRVTVHCSFAGIGASGGLMINFKMSSPEVRGAISILMPQPTIARRALAKWHSKKRWMLLSTSALKKIQAESICCILRWRFSLVGMTLAPILHNNIFRRSGSLAFHKFFQRELTGLPSQSWVKATWWKDFTVKVSLRSGSQMSLSCLGWCGIGIERMVCTTSSEKISFTMSSFHTLEVWSMRWFALMGSWR